MPLFMAVAVLFLAVPVAVLAGLAWLIGVLASARSNSVEFNGISEPAPEMPPYRPLLMEDVLADYRQAADSMQAQYEHAMARIVGGDCE